MKTKHAEIRAQQRGINYGIEYLLQSYGDIKPAPKGCVMRYFSKKAIREIETDFGWVNWLDYDMFENCLLKIYFLFLINCFFCSSLSSFSIRTLLMLYLTSWFYKS